ncbi:MAG: creatininase family protein [Lachnospiraceae bacterium]|nr:creatininase family protein [Lachnospiraceae bacterium]
MKDLSLMTWKEIKEVNKKDSVVFVVMAPIEEHGWCLPLATDIIEGENWSRGAMEMIEKNSRIKCYYLPTFPVAAASVNTFYGSVHFSMRTTFEVAYEILDSVRHMGFESIVIIASHADPDHQIAVIKAVRKINRKYGICAIAPMGSIFEGTGVEPTEDIKELEKDYSNDFHAGWIETSSMLDIDDNNVRSGFNKLPDSNITDKDMISKRKQLAAMGEYGHIGLPRIATKEIGHDLNRNCIESISEAVIKFYNRAEYKKYDNYFLYKILPLHIGFLKIFGKVKRGKVGE